MKRNFPYTPSRNPISKQPALAAIASLIFPALAWASPITSYVHSTIHLRDCVTACFQPNSISLQQFIDEDYGEDGHAEVHSVWKSLNNQSAGSAGFSGNAYAPTLSAYSYTSDKFQYTTGTFGFHRYEFTAPGTITVDGHLTYSQSGIEVPQDRGAHSEGLITALIFSFQMNNNVFDMDECIVPNAQLIVFGKTPRICSLAPALPLGGLMVSMPNQYNFQVANFNTGLTAVSGGTLERSLTISGNAGDVFYLGAQLAALAHFDGFADSRNTLRLSVDNPDIISPSFAQDSYRAAPLSTPEPSAALLLLSGVLLLARRARK